MYNNPGQHGYHKASTIAFGCLLQSTDPKDSPLYTLSLLIYTGKACVSPWVVCVINSMGALEKGSPAKHVGSCQTVHALGRGWVCVAVCECGLSKGWVGFWEAWKTQWQGYIEEERGSCARQHVGVSMFECDTRSSARMGGLRWSILGVMPSVIKQQWEITELCLVPPWGVLGVLISTEHQLYWRSTDFKTLESHIIFYWTCVEALSNLLPTTLHIHSDLTANAFFTTAGHTI